MPAAPEVDDVDRLVGGVEVDRQADAEHPAEADRHVGIAGEVEVQLEGVGQRPAPGLEQGRFVATVGGGEHRRGVDRDAVGQDHLLEQPDGEDRQADREVVQIDPIGAVLGELRDHLAVVNDRPGDQLRKEGHEQGVVDEALVTDLAAIGVDQIGDLLEGEERDRQRQHDVVDAEVDRQQRLDQVGAEEARVFEVADAGQIGADAEAEQELRPGHQQPLADEEIERDRGDDQDQIDRVPPAVEEQRGGDQPGDGEARLLAATEDEEADQGDRQEDQDELERVEQHAECSSLAGLGAGLGGCADARSSTPRYLRLTGREL